MIKKILKLIYVILPLLMTTGCRVNNGDIGLLYGTWTLTSMEVDGSQYTSWNTDGYEDTFFQFQNNICFVTGVDSYFEARNIACTWKWIQDDVKIQLDFTHVDSANPEPGGYMYAPPAWLLLNEPTLYNFDVVWTDDRHMVWTTVNTAGQRLTYHMRKTY